MITPLNKENVNVTKSPLFLKSYDGFIQITKKIITEILILNI